jgi:hypothetical protein
MRSLLLLALPAFVLACTPYDPDLGPTPFRCGMSDPKCPDGYTCNTENVCSKDSGDPGSPDANDNNFQCADDHTVEPNNSTSNATTTPIPDVNTCVSEVGLAICPDSDLDLFRFRIDDVATKNVEARVTADLSVGNLQLKVLNGSGAVIGNGVQADANTVKIQLQHLAAGTYFVQVSAPTGVENNYSLDILTCAPSGTGCPGACGS